MGRVLRTGHRRKRSGRQRRWEKAHDEDPRAVWVPLTSSHPMLPPVQAAVQVAEGGGQPPFQDVVDHLLGVIVVLQAGQDEALAKVWQQVLYLGDGESAPHTVGPGGCGRPQALRKRPRGCPGLGQGAPNSTGLESGDLA